MATDWHDSLKALAGALPDAPDAPETPAPSQATSAAPRERLDIYVERKGRGGKTATIVTGFTDDDTAADTAARLKKRLGAGGSARGGEILIQGDRAAAVRDALAALGFKSRLCNV